MQQISVASKDVSQWLRDRNKLKKDWGFKLKGLLLQGKKVLDYLKTLHIESVSKIISESDFEK